MLSQVFCCCSGEECSSALKHCFQDQLYMIFMYSELLQIFSAYNLGLYHQCKETFERTNVLCLTYVFLGYACLFLIMFCNCWLLRFLVLFLCQEWISSAGWCFAWCCRRRHFRFVSLESFIINCYYIIYFEIHGWYCVGIAIWSFCLL